MAQSARRQSVGIGAKVHKRTLSSEGGSLSASQLSHHDVGGSPSIGSPSQCTPPPRFDRGARRESSVLFTTDESLSTSCFAEKPVRRVTATNLDSNCFGDDKSGEGIDEAVDSPDHQTKYNVHDEGKGDDEAATRNRLIRINSQLNADDIFTANKNHNSKAAPAAKTQVLKTPPSSRSSSRSNSRSRSRSNSTTYSDDVYEEEPTNPDYISEDDGALVNTSCTVSPAYGGAGGGRRGNQVKALGLASSQSHSNSNSRFSPFASQADGSGVFDEVDAKIFIYLQLVQWGPMRHAFAQWKHFMLARSTKEFKTPPLPAPSNANPSPRKAGEGSILRFAAPKVPSADSSTPKAPVKVPSLDLRKVNSMKAEDEGLTQGPPPVVRSNGSVDYVAPRPGKGVATAAKTKPKVQASAGANDKSSKKPSQFVSAPKTIAQPEKQKRPVSHQTRLSGTKDKDEEPAAKPRRLSAAISATPTKAKENRSPLKSKPQSPPKLRTPAKEQKKSQSPTRQSAGSVTPTPPPVRGASESPRTPQPQRTGSPAGPPVPSGGSSGVRKLPRVAMLGSTPEKKKDGEGSNETSPEKHKFLRRNGGAPRCAPAPTLRPDVDLLLQDSQAEYKGPKPDLRKLPDPDAMAGRREGFHVDAFNVGHHSRWGHAHRRHYAGGAQGGNSAL